MHDPILWVAVALGPLQPDRVLAGSLATSVDRYPRPYQRSLQRLGRLGWAQTTRGALRLAKHIVPR
jgi:hypothetical protein